MEMLGLIPESEIKGEDENETAELLSMLSRAKSYISSFRWCPPISRAWMGLGIGGVVAVFLVRFDEPIENDEYLWVVEGDLPSAYLVIDNAKDPVSALEVYCELMKDWVTAVEKGQPFEDVFPIDAPRDARHAAILSSRLEYIRSRIVPEYRA